MQVKRWGNSLAICLPAEFVRELGLKEGDYVDLRPGKHELTVMHRQSPKEVLASLRQFRGCLPTSACLTRDEANER